MDISRVLEDLGLGRVRLGRGDLAVYSPLDSGEIGRLQHDAGEISSGFARSVRKGSKCDVIVS